MYVMLCYVMLMEWNGMLCYVCHVMLCDGTVCYVMLMGWNGMEWTVM